MIPGIPISRLLTPKITDRPTERPPLVSEAKFACGLQATEF
jgi:hypothetical protein